MAWRHGMIAYAIIGPTITRSCKVRDVAWRPDHSSVLATGSDGWLGGNSTAQYSVSRKRSVTVPWSKALPKSTDTFDMFWQPRSWPENGNDGKHTCARSTSLDQSRPVLIPQELGSNGGDLVSRDGRPGAAMQISVVSLAIFTLFVNLLHYCFTWWRFFFWNVWMVAGDTAKLGVAGWFWIDYVDALSTKRHAEKFILQIGCQGCPTRTAWAVQHAFNHHNPQKKPGGPHSDKYSRLFKVDINWHKLTIFVKILALI